MMDSAAETIRSVSSDDDLEIDHGGAPEAQLMLHTALDERRSAEQSLLELMERVSQVVLVERHGRVVHANATAARVLGYQSTFDLVGTPSMELLGPASRGPVSRSFRDEELPAEPAPLLERVYRRPDGVEVTMEVSSFALPFRGELAIVTLGRDLTEQRKLEQRMQAADRMVSVGTLAAGVAHEINNPLAYVIGNLAFLGGEIEQISREDSAALPEARRTEIEGALQDARDGVERVRVIVRDLKTFSRGDDEDDRHPVDVRQVLDSAIKMSWNEIRHRAQLIREYAEVPFIVANEGRMGQLFLNLLMNAAQAIPEGSVDRNRIRVANRIDGERILIEVQDTGIGIPAQNIKRLFDPFFTTKPVGVGTGLGLSICNNIVTALGGELRVESTVGKGSTFRVYLPVSSQSMPDGHDVEEPAAAPAHKPVVQRSRVLVIDDEPMVSLSVKRLLASEHEVLQASSPVGVLERLLGGERIDLIVCDLLMPKMTGMELHAQLLARLPQHAERMVFLTGGTFTPSAREFLDRVPNQRLEKPFEGRALRRVVSDGIKRNH